MRLKGFKKFILIVVSVWLVIVIAGLLFSRSMQGKIIDILSEQAGKHLTTEIHIRKNGVHFSIFKRFPLASVELRNVCVKVPPSVNLLQSNLMKGDTLLYAKSLYLQLNLKNLLHKNYELQKIQLKDGFLQILSDKKGNSSLNILRKKSASDSADYIANIKALSVSNLTLYTSDKSNQSKSVSLIKTGFASGSFTKHNFSVKLKTSGRMLLYTVKDQKLEANQSFAIDTDINRSKNRYSIYRGSFNLSNIPFTVVGTITPGNNTLIDLIFSAKSVPLKQIDKTVLHGLLGESGFVLKGGTINIQSTLLGYTRYSSPSIKANFVIQNGKVYDSGRKLLYEKIYMAGNADNGKLHLPKTSTIRIDSFKFQTGSSWQGGKFKIQNLINPTLSASLYGVINVTDVNRLVKIPNIQLNEGLVKNKLLVSGTIHRDAEAHNRLLDNLKIWGNLSIRDLGLVFEKYKIPYTRVTGDIRIKQDLSLQFDKLYAKCGHSDIQIDGTLRNVLRNGKIAGFQGKVNSDLFLVDDFIQPSQSGVKNAKAIFFPDSVNIHGIISIQKFKFGNFTTQNLQGQIDYRNKLLKMSSFSMEGFEGRLVGKISIHQEKSNIIKMVADGNLSNVNIKQLFIGCNNFSQNVITSEFLGGEVLGKMAFTSKWSNRLEFIPEELMSSNSIVITNGELTNYQPLLGLSKFIEVEELQHIKFDKLSTNVSIHNKKVILDQTTIASSAIAFDGSGMHGFDNKYEYRLQLGLSDILWKKAKRKKSSVTEFGYIIDDGVGHTMLPIILSGKGKSFDVKYDKKTAGNKFRQKLLDEKKELKELFKRQEKDLNSDEHLIEHELIDGNKFRKTDTGTYEVKNKEHSIIWDDSPEDEDDEGGE